MKQSLFAALLLGIASLAGAQADELHLRSGIEQTRMIELFTSEGCSSCPPAEAFLNRFKENKGLWSRYIPLAFHVDYWDYLGWRDPFAKAAYSQRQRKYARALRMRTVYTPGLFANGVEWRNWRWGREPFDDDKVGRLEVTVQGERLQARFIPERKLSQPLQLYVAVLGMGLVSEIKAGENRGRISHHEFVVLGQRRYDSDTLQWRGALPTPSQAAGRYALVAWVSRPSSPAPLQAVGGYLPGTP